MPDQEVPLTIFHMLERNLGKEIRVILDASYVSKARWLRLRASLRGFGFQMLRQLYFELRSLSPYLPSPAEKKEAKYSFT
jgi:hypothetical protein